MAKPDHTEYKPNWENQDGRKRPRAFTADVRIEGHGGIGGPGTQVNMSGSKKLRSCNEKLARKEGERAEQVPTASPNPRKETQARKKRKGFRGGGDQCE